MYTISIRLASKVLVQSLSSIRSILSRLEETIIFSTASFVYTPLCLPITVGSGLIERAQFAHNAIIYEKDGFKDVLHQNGFVGSWLDWFLLQTETMHGVSHYAIEHATEWELIIPSSVCAQPKSDVMRGTYNPRLLSDHLEH